MALDNYANLKLAVADWMHRSNLTGNIPDFIVLAEATINRVLQARFSNIVGSISTVAGQDYASLPSDLVRLTSVSIPDIRSSIGYVTPNEYQRLYNTTLSGIPAEYTTIGDLIYFGPTPDAVYTVQCVFQQQVPALTDLAPVNSLLTKWPDVYLWGVLTQAAKYCRNWELRDNFVGDFQVAIAQVNLVDWQTQGPMRARSDVRSV